MVKLLYTNTADFQEHFANWTEIKPESGAAVQQTVQEIIQNVQEKGDTKLLEYTARFDRWSPKNTEELQVTPKQIDDAYACCSKDIIGALEMAAERIREYHERQMPTSFEYKDNEGVMLGNRWTALESGVKIES
jgi:histidinol dehydrogenase